MATDNIRGLHEADIAIVDEEIGNESDSDRHAANTAARVFAAVQPYPIRDVRSFDHLDGDTPHIYFDDTARKERICCAVEQTYRRGICSIAPSKSNEVVSQASNGLYYRLKFQYKGMQCIGFKFEKELNNDN